MINWEECIVRFRKPGDWLQQPKSTCALMTLHFTPDIARYTTVMQPLMAKAGRLLLKTLSSTLIV